MEYKKFKDLLNNGECKNIDYKLMCNAFNKQLPLSDKAKAELIKDIIAMSNNGNLTNYIIIGVSDNRAQFKSVENEKLTDDNLQILCKDNIFPIPRVKLFDCCWDNIADDKINGVKFKIIQVGPQARNCFRFSRDHISFNKNYCFKKNEVWLRREATSDLASPEEIKYLLEGKDPIKKISLEDSVDYTRLPVDEWRNSIFNDLGKYASTIEAKLEHYSNKDHKFYNSIRKLTINIRGLNIVLAVVIGEKLTSKAVVYKICKEIQFLYHGILIITQKGITDASLEHSKIKIKENWGWFVTYTNMSILLRQLSKRYYDKYNKYEIFCICLKNIKSTENLFFSCEKSIDSIIKEEDIYAHVNKICQMINEVLILWRQDNCVIETDQRLSRYYIEKIQKGETIKKKLLKNEFFDIKKYGDKIMRYDDENCALIDELID